MEAPEKIFLQVDQASESGNEFEHEGVTWGDERIDDSDVEYIRADLIPPIAIVVNERDELFLKNTSLEIQLVDAIGKLRLIRTLVKDALVNADG